MKKQAITVLIMGVFSISVLQAQSDFGPLKHNENITIQEQVEKTTNDQKSIQAYSLPFQEEFESTSFPPLDWMSYIGSNGAGPNYNWERRYPGYSGYGAQVRYEKDGGQVCEDWLVTPQITLGENTTLTFYEKQKYNSDYGTTYTVKISTASQDNYNDFTNLISYTESDISTSYNLRMIDLSAYDGQDVYLAFVMYNDDGDNWYIDNVSVTDNPGGGGTPGGDILISEVAYPIDADGSNARFVELYNSGTEIIDLSNYYLAFYRDNRRILLNGEINPGETFVYAPNASNFYQSYGFYPDFADGGISSTWFTGTDAIYLLEQVGSQLYRRDTYGATKTDGTGLDWEYTGRHAVRNPAVTSYQSNFDIAEWEISSAYYYYRDVTPGNFNTVYYWTGNYNNEWDEYRNWSVNTGFDAIPDAGANVVIPPGANNEASLGYYIFPYYFNSLTVQTGATFTLKSHNILHIKNDINIESGAQVFLESDSYGASAFIPQGTINGQINIERWFPSIGGTPTNGEWHYFSPPITNLTSNDFFDQYLMYWDESITQWQYITATDYTLIPGLGYGVLLQDSFGSTIDMSGNLVNEDVQSPILKSTNGSGWQGWNLIGNPFSASLDWEKVVNNLPDGVDQGIHYWDQANEQYVFYNNGNGTASQYIPPMQGFFIHTNTDNAQFTIPADARSYQGVDVFYKSMSDKPFDTYTPPKREHFNRIIITTESTYGKSDQAFLEFHERATVNFDDEFDAIKFNSGNDSIPEPYLLFNGTKYAINLLPETIIDGSYDLCVNYGMNGAFTLTFEDLDSFEETQSIVLHDKLEDQYFDLKQISTISFFNDVNNPENRFELIFDNMVGINDMNPSTWLVYSTDGKLNIRNNIQQTNNKAIIYQIFSLDGKQIFEGQFDSQITQKHFDLAYDIYLIKIIEPEAQYTYKVVLHQ